MVDVYKRQTRSGYNFRSFCLLLIICVLLYSEVTDGLKSRRYGLKGRRSRGLNGRATVDNPPAIPRRKKFDQGPMEKLNMWIDGDEIEEFVGKHVCLGQHVDWVDM